MKAQHVPQAATANHVTALALIGETGTSSSEVRSSQTRRNSQSRKQPRNLLSRRRMIGSAVVVITAGTATLISIMNPACKAGGGSGLNHIVCVVQILRLVEPRVIIVAGISVRINIDLILDYPKQRCVDLL